MDTENFILWLQNKQCDDLHAQSDLGICPSRPLIKSLQLEETGRVATFQNKLKQCHQYRQNGYSSNW